MKFRVVKVALLNWVETILTSNIHISIYFCVLILLTMVILQFFWLRLKQKITEFFRLKIV